MRFLFFYKKLFFICYNMQQIPNRPRYNKGGLPKDTFYTNPLFT